MTDIADLQRRVEGIEEKLDRSTADINAKVDSLATAVDLTNVKLDLLIAQMNKMTLPATTQPCDDGNGEQTSMREEQKPKKTEANEKDKDGHDTASSRFKTEKKTEKSKLKKPKKKDSSESEEDDDYGLNNSGFTYDATDIEDDDRASRRGNFRRQPTSLNIEEFNFGEDSADWTSWVRKFQGTVKSAYNPRDEAEHHKLNLRWLPTYLNIAAHDIFLNCRHRKNWRKVVEELEEAFDDPGIKQRWATDLKAYMWDQKIPLHVYRSNVVHFVDKFELGLRQAPVARKKAYFTRFVGGLPDDYINFIEQQLYGNKQTIEHALKVSQQFKIIQDRNMGPEENIAGATASQEKSRNERIHALERQMAWLDKKRGN